MIAAWKEPQVEDVTTYMRQVVVDRTDDNDRVQKVLTATVVHVRGVVGRTNTLSDKNTEVPPEGLRHCLILAVFDLLNGTPNFQFLIRGPDGGETGFGLSIRMANTWLNDVKRGLSVTYPTNPQDNYPELIRYGGDDNVDHTAA